MSFYESVALHNSTPISMRGERGGGRHPRRGGYQDRGGYQGGYQGRGHGGFQKYGGYQNRGSHRGRNGYRVVDNPDGHNNGLPKRKMADDEQLKKFLGEEYQVVCFLFNFCYFNLSINTLNNYH